MGEGGAQSTLSPFGESELYIHEFPHKSTNRIFFTIVVMYFTGKEPVLRIDGGGG